MDENGIRMEKYIDEISLRKDLKWLTKEFLNSKMIEVEDAYSIFIENLKN